MHALALTGGHPQNRRLTRVSSVSISFVRGLLSGQRAEALIHRLGLDDLRSLYYLALQRALWSKGTREKASPTSITYYEFGVGWGYTLTRYLDALKAFTGDEHLDIHAQKIFLFDSFEGLPAGKGDRDDHHDWNKGSFAHDVNEIKGVLREYKLDPDSSSNIKFTKGFFEDSLTPSLAQQLATTPPDIITIDVDYYSSAKTVLDWLRPLLPAGCLFYFDDLWSFNGSSTRGELGAINEFNKNGQGRLLPFQLVPTLADLCYIYTPD